MRHTIAFADPAQFAGWPANNGLWRWPDGEVLTGCVTGAYTEQEGHNLLEPYTHRLLRTLDGGQHWTVETPADYVGTGTLAPLAQPMDFSAPGFALRVVGRGYHGAEEPRGGFYASADRGHTWQGPFGFTGLFEHPQLLGEDWSPRTDYVVLGQRELLVMLSVRGGVRWKTDRVFCAHTADGGQSFTFRGWLVPEEDNLRSVMPATVRLADGSLVCAARRRGDEEQCWIDAYGSTDEGYTWGWLSRVAGTGGWNGNPPALALLADGRLCCVFGNRSQRAMLARFSADGGRDWTGETLLRDDFYNPDGEPDFGYPRLTCLPGGDLLALYYWSTDERPYQHIAATRWTP